MVEPLVLPDTPDVLSIGRRCMHMGYGFYWHPGRNPYLVTPEGNVVPLLVRKDIPYMVVGSSRSLPKNPKAFIEVPVMPVVEQGTSAQMDAGEQTCEVKATGLQNSSDASQTTSVENRPERNPYGYTGPLSGECEIPLDVLKRIYEMFGDDCEDGDCDNCNAALVVEEEGKDAEVQSCSDVSEKDIQASPGNSDDTEPAVRNSPPEKRRRIDVDPVDTDDEENLCNDSCGCACGCRVFPNRHPMTKCMNCQQAICSGCRHVGSQGGILCHVCRD